MVDETFVLSYHSQMEDAMANFLVMNREGIQVYQEDRPHIVISISDPETTPPNLPDNENRLGLLRLQFYDLDHTKGLSQLLRERVKDSLFTEGQAKQVLRFFREFYPTKAQVVIVNCEAGISRSAAIAAALCKIGVGHDHLYFRKYIPNRRVYSYILSEHFKGDISS